MTIQQAIDSGSIPSVDETYLLNICQKVGINADNLNYVLKDGELERLRYNSEIHYHYAIDRTRKAHSKLTDNYGKLIDKYKKLSAGMTDPSLADDKAKIDALVEKLTEAQKAYNNQTENIFLTEDNLNLDAKVFNPVQEIRMDILDKRQENVDEELQEAYKTLDTLQGLNFSTPKEIRKNNRDIKSVQRIIKRLQRKQGRLQSTQQKIINRGIEKYKKIKEAEFKKLTRQIDNKVKQVDYKKDMESNQEKINLFASKPGLFNKFRTAVSKIDQRRMERKLKGLKRKEEVLEYLVKSGKNIKLKDFVAQLFRPVEKNRAHSR